MLPPFSSGRIYPEELVFNSKPCREFYASIVVRPVKVVPLLQIRLPSLVIDYPRKLAPDAD
jgi:hypothetical protein